MYVPIGAMPRPVWHAKNIGILGGTFNPVHCGHIEMARAAIKEFAFDEIWLMPSRVPPHKPFPFMASEQHRWRMVVIACEDEPQLVPSAFELQRSGTTFTVDTLRELNKDGGASYSFIMGSDTLLQMETWRDPQTVFDLCNFIVFARAGIDDASVAVKIQELRAKFGARIVLGLHRCIRISATQIRQRIENGLSLKGFVPKAIEAYIQEYNVYGGQH